MKRDGDAKMSNREKCHAIIESFTDEQLSSIAALLTSVRTLANESADDAYCLQLYADYQADQDKGEPVAIEHFAKSLGISL